MNKKIFLTVLTIAVTAMFLAACSENKATPTPSPQEIVEAPTAEPTQPPVSIDGIVLDSDYIISVLDKAKNITCSYKADYSSDGTDRKVQFWQLDDKKKIVISSEDTQIITVTNSEGTVFYDTKTKELKKADGYLNPAYEKLNPEIAKTTTFFYQSQKRINGKSCLEISWIDETGQKMYASISESDGIIMKVFTDSNEYVYSYCVTDFTTEGIEPVALELPGEITAN